MLLLPLVLLAFQGNIIFALAEKVDWQGWYSPIHQKEIELGRVNAEHDAITLRGVPDQERRESNRRLSALRARQTALELEIKSLRTPLTDISEFWNFSFVKLWPLSLLLLPFLTALVWFAMPSLERRELYEEALSSGARNRGLLLGLAAIALFWFGGWINASLARAYFDTRGAGTFVPPLWMRSGFFFCYLSYAAWTAAAAYAFTGWRGLRRLWLPVAAIMTLAVLNYGAVSNNWTQLWDTHPQWEYGYIIGPIAAYLLYCLLTEKTEQWRHDLLDTKLPAAAREFSIAASWPVAEAQNAIAAGDSRAVALKKALGRPGQLLLVFGLLVTLGTLAGWGVLILGVQHFGQRYGLQGNLDLANIFAWFPLAAGVGLLIVGAWQRAEKDRRSDLAARLAGVIVVLATLGWRWQAVNPDHPISYFNEITIIMLLLGGVLAVFGYAGLRVAWVPILFLGLAIPWPERTLISLAGPLQEYAADITVRALNVLHPSWYVIHNGTQIIVGPTETDVLKVAEECSGLKILFSFLALAVVYAYISHRPLWRRLVIVLSALPIAVLANVTRVFIMALFYRWGYKEIVEGLTHQVVGYVMLPEAFLLLYLEMRLLDLLEKLANWLAKDDSGRPASAADRPPAGGAA